MLLFLSTPDLLSEAAHLESQLQTPQESIAPSAPPVQTKRPQLSMVWRKEFDGKRERMVARWVIDQ